MFKVNVVLVFLPLTLNIFHIFYGVFISDFEQVNVTLVGARIFLLRNLNNKKYRPENSILDHTHSYKNYLFL